VPWWRWGTAEPRRAVHDADGVEQVVRVEALAEEAARAGPHGAVDVLVVFEGGDDQYPDAGQCRIRRDQFGGGQAVAGMRMSTSATSGMVVRARSTVLQSRARANCDPVGCGEGMLAEPREGGLRPGPAVEVVDGVEEVHPGLPVGAAAARRGGSKGTTVRAMAGCWMSS